MLEVIAITTFLLSSKPWYLSILTLFVPTIVNLIFPFGKSIIFLIEPITPILGKSLILGSSSNVSRGQTKSKLPLWCLLEIITKISSFLVSTLISWLGRMIKSFSIITGR